MHDSKVSILNNNWKQIGNILCFQKYLNVCHCTLLFEVILYIRILANIEIQ